MPLQMESTTGILIDQVHKFQNSYFKEHLWKAVTVLSKTYCLKYAHDTIFQKALALKLIETLNASSFVSSFLNFVLLVVLQFLSATLAYNRALNERSCWLIEMYIKKTQQAPAFSFMVLNLVEKAVLHFLLIIF